MESVGFWFGKAPAQIGDFLSFFWTFLKSLPFVWAPDLTGGLVARNLVPKLAS